MSFFKRSLNYIPTFKKQLIKRAQEYYNEGKMLEEVIDRYFVRSGSTWTVKEAALRDILVCEWPGFSLFDLIEHWCYLKSCIKVIEKEQK